MTETVELHGGPQDGRTLAVPENDPLVRVLVMTGDFGRYRLTAVDYVADPDNPSHYYYERDVLYRDAPTKLDAVAAVMSALESETPTADSEHGTQDPAPPSQ